MKLVIPADDDAVDLAEAPRPSEVPAENDASRQTGEYRALDQARDLVAAGDAAEIERLRARLWDEIQINDTLCRVGAAFARELNHHKLVQLIIDEATALSGATCGAFYLFEGNAVSQRSSAFPQGLQRQRLHVVAGSAPEAFDRFLGGAGAALFQAIQRGEPAMRLSDVSRDPRCAAVSASRSARERQAVGGEVCSFLAVPVAARHGQVLGGLFFSHDGPGHFTRGHERLVAALAVQAAVALQNARLYEALRDSEAAAHRAYEAARQAERRKDEFLAMLGHELRNPLSPIVTALQVLQLKRDGAAPEREWKVIERQVRHLTGLVDDLLDISRITRGKVVLDKDRLQVASVVARAVEMVSPALEERSHRLSVSVPKRLMVDGDEMRLVQVVTNLLSNAAKYTAPGGRVHVLASREGSDVVLRVRDTGVGIHPQILPHVFDLFTQADRTLDRKPGGLGIGLTVVKTLVSLHGGTVAAISGGQDKGSEFRVRLPLALGDRPPQRAGGRRDAGRVRNSSLPDPRMRILVVDDNVDAAEALTHALRLLGYECRNAYDGPSALQVAQEFKPEAAVLDIGLPVMDGYELAMKLREVPGLAAMKLIAVTGYSQQRDRIRSAQAGIDAHLIKPVSLEDLRHALQSQVEEASAS